MSETIIETQGVTRIYHQGKIEIPALRGVDLEITEGEFTALVGPSGSGKSTLLNMIGCLDTPTEGTVFLEGNPVPRMSRRQAALYRLERIGFIFQAYNLSPVFNALENAEYTLLLQGVSKAERRKRVTELLERVGLSKEMKRRPHEMSGGQQQRVAVVRALAAKPKVVLADEPTANLDSETGGQLLELMLELNREKGTTFVFASHDAQVMEAARRVVTLKDGLVDSDVSDKEAA